MTRPLFAAATVARAACRELAAAVLFSAACAAVLTSLGSAVTTLVVRGVDGSFAVLSLRSHVAIALPAFFGAWAFWLVRGAATKTRARAAWTAGALAVGGALVHRIALWTDASASATATVLECADEVCVSVVRADADVVAAALSSIRHEATYLHSLLWCSVAATALLAAAAWALQPRLRARAPA